jgi:inosine-uridine nucleoside N-ribohydrolase
MGESRDEEARSVEELRAEWRAIVESGEAVPGSGLAEMSARMRATGNWPEDLRDAPLIIDTDIGGDADDALAVAVAARSVPQLSLVLTSDETGTSMGYGKRARFARLLLDLLDRPDVPTVSGVSLGETPYYCVEDLVPETIDVQPNDPVEAVRRVCAASQGPVRWVGMGPLSNLERVLSEAPELAPRIRLTQMGGALNYRDPSRAEHNIRLDVPAAQAVFRMVAGDRLPVPHLVTSDVTFTSDIEITAEHPVYRMLARAEAPAWARLLVAHMDRWFERFHPGTMQHDALTLSAALRLPFVDFDRVPVALDEIGRMSGRASDGVRMWLSLSARYPAFMRWLGQRLDPAVGSDRKV